MGVSGAFQEEVIASAKAPRQEWAWSIRGTGRRPVWLELSGRGQGMKAERELNREYLMWGLWKPPLGLCFDSGRQEPQGVSELKHRT